MAKMLYPDEKPTVNRHSSIDQFSNGFLSVYKQGGWAPILFDQLDGITCDTVKTHPVIISFGGDLGYIFPEAHCAYTSDKFLYFNKEGVEKQILPSEFGGDGELIDVYTSENTFINFDNDTSVGTHSTLRTRTGLSYVIADETLPSVD